MIDQQRADPTDEEVAAIVAAIFAAQPEAEVRMPNQIDSWRLAARREGVERWTQPFRQSRLWKENTVK